MSTRLHKAVTSAWNESGLDWIFKQRWAEADRTVYTALNDGEAAPGTPQPYCVYQEGTGTVTDRMSGDTATENHMIVDVPWTFRIHTLTSTTGESAKTVALILAEHILRIFGGHPDPQHKPKTLTLNGVGFLITQYVTDYGLRTGDEAYQWTVEYRIRLDQPFGI